MIEITQQHYLVRLFSRFLITVVATLLVACESDSEVSAPTGQSGQPGFSLVAPRILLESRMINPEALVLTVSANGSLVTMIPNTESNNWTGQLVVEQGQSIGLSIGWSIFSPQQGREVDLATLTRTISNVNENLFVSFDSSQYIYPNDDGDSLSNLAEIELEFGNTTTGNTTAGFADGGTTVGGADAGATTGGTTGATTGATTGGTTDGTTGSTTAGGTTTGGTTTGGTTTGGTTAGSESGLVDASQVMFNAGQSNCLTESFINEAIQVLFEDPPEFLFPTPTEFPFQQLQLGDALNVTRSFVAEDRFIAGGLELPGDGTLRVEHTFGPPENSIGYIFQRRDTGEVERLFRNDDPGTGDSKFVINERMSAGGYCVLVRRHGANSNQPLFFPPLGEEAGSIMLRYSFTP